MVTLMLHGGLRYIDSRDRCRCTPLHIAVDERHVGAVRLLLEYGARARIVRTLEATRVQPLGFAPRPACCGRRTNCGYVSLNEPMIASRSVPASVVSSSLESSRLGTGSAAFKMRSAWQQSFRNPATSDRCHRSNLVQFMGAA
eukprot:6211463-Pleurochrysis_carterae.AAC.2